MKRVIEFTVIPLSDDALRCARCGRKMRTGDAAQSVIENSHVHYEHRGACPTDAPHVPTPRVIQGAK